jgi:hypothetical protein
MDKARYPHVTRTWSAERTRVLYRPAHSAKGLNPRRDVFHNPFKPHPPRGDR